MAWYDEAVFYHIYPLGLTGAPHENHYEEPVHRLNELLPWIDHILEIGCNALYIGPLFESVGHGYETTDYKKLDSRLGTNEDLKKFVQTCHEKGVRVIFDGVFNHTGRDFFAFKDIQANRENSRYKDWYCNVNFWGNNEYNDGFTYENWGGYNLLAKLNQRNGEVQGYICDVIRYWVSEFDVDGIRLDAADVLDFEFMKMLRRIANEVKPDFYLMGEVIHGDYTRWVNNDTLHAVTNYTMHKAFFSGHNDHNYFEIAHTERRLQDMAGRDVLRLRLYNFVDNHDVERIYNKLNNKAQLLPVHVLLYTLPGVPSIYYGSEFGIEGRKGGGDDWAIRPQLNLADFADATNNNPLTNLIAKLGRVRQHVKALSYGAYNELALTNRQYAFSRSLPGENVIVAVNNDDNSAWMNLPSCGVQEYVGALSGVRVHAEGDRLNVEIPACGGEILIPADLASTLDLTKANVQAIEKYEADVRVDAKTADEADVRVDAKTADEADVRVDAKAADEADGRVDAKTADDADVHVDENADAGTEGCVENDANVETTPDTVDETATHVENAQPAGVTFAETMEQQAPAADALINNNGNPVPETVREGISYEEMTVEELERCVLDKMAKNGPVNDQMKHTVLENVYHDSLVNWVKSFR